ncbi:DUF3784 domain-containing protein [Lacinutrix chionoecetis]
MIYSQILISIILITCGFLVKKYPNLIAGYNTMPQVEKEKININALSSFLKQLLIGLGIITALVYIAFKLFSLNETDAIKINTVIILVGIILGLIYANVNNKFKN